MVRIQLIKNSTFRVARSGNELFFLVPLYISSRLITSFVFPVHRQVTLAVFGCQLTQNTRFCDVFSVFVDTILHDLWKESQIPRLFQSDAEAFPSRRFPEPEPKREMRSNFMRASPHTASVLSSDLNFRLC